MSSVKEGWMTKRGGTIRTWKKRWFVLQENIIYYYDKPGHKLKGTIELTSDCAADLATKSECRKDMAFKVKVPAVRTYFIVAPNDTERQAWIEVINKTISNLNAPTKKVESTTAPVVKSAAEKPKQPVNLDCYDILKVLGRGTYGKVQLVRSKMDGKLYAMKTMGKKLLEETEQIEQALTEKNILLKTGHPFLVSAHATFQTKQKIFMILDYVPGGELFGRLKEEGSFSLERTRLYAAEIVTGLGHLHNLGYVYRDLKPENILIDSEGHLKITDFGLVKTSAQGQTFCGTPEYIAPEMIQQHPYTKCVDWWSFGILVFEMLTGLPPFYDENTNRMYRMILQDDVIFPEDMDPDAVDFINRLLHKIPDLRLGSGENGLEEIKSHPFFASLNWDDVLNKRTKPEWVPDIKDELDVSNFDQEFINEVAGNTYEDESIIGTETQENFQGFTCVQESVLDRV